MTQLLQQVATPLLILQFDAQGRITAAANGTIATAEIADGAVNNAKVNASAAIAGTKISPDFGSQNIVTTGSISGAAGTFTGDVSIPDKIVHTGDTHTAMRFTGNDTIAFDTGGTSRVQITDSTTEVGNDLSIADKIIHTGDTNTAIRFPAADTFSVETAGSERSRIDSSGRLLLGTNTSRAAGGNTHKLFQIESTDATSGLSLTRNSASTTSSIISFAKSRGTSNGSNTIVQDNDELGRIKFSGADGTDLLSEAARIQAFVDNTPGSNDMPGRLTFSTTADGAVSPTERMRIDSLGRLDFAGDDNNSTGTGVLRVKHYAHSSNLPVNMIGVVAGNGFNNVHIGGNDTSYTGTAATTIRFYTASNSTTANGTEAARIINSGDIVCHGTGLNNSSVSGQALQVQGTTRPTLILRGNASGSNQCEIQFADNSGSDSDPGTRVGMIQYDHSTNNFRVQVNEVTRFKIPSKGGIHAEFNDGDSLGYRFKRVQGSNNHNLLATTHSSGGIDGGGTESLLYRQMVMFKI